ncbi:MAG: hypothetical protein LBF08_01335 [Dysgonamonadaceae bacterium]|jgi:hypothetical protein|nr:hypothetical protein [Dysgonamonadaceae bacterium]
MTKKRQHLAALFIIAIAGLGLVTFSGSIFSGYHFMDCHYYTEVKEQMTNYSFSDILIDMLKNDTGIRFRPMWKVSDIFEIAMWGDNMFLHGLWQIVVNICAAYLIYLLGRNMAWSHKESLLFAGLSLIGTQSAIFYQTEVIEPLGLVFLILSWLSLQNYIKTTAILRKTHYALFVGFSILMALCRENFILVLPASYVFYCMLYSEKHSDSSLIGIISKTWKTALFLFLLTVVCLISTLIFAGAGGTGYAGVSAHTGLAQYFKTTIYLFVISGCSLLSLPCMIWLLKKRGTTVKNRLYSVLLLAFITIPQILLYAKSNIIDRYLIPSVIGCAYFAIFVYREIQQNEHTVKRRRWKNLSLLLGILIVIACGIIIYSENIRQWAVDFAVQLQGNAVRNMTAESSKQYLLSTIFTMNIAVLLLGIGFCVWGCIKRKEDNIKISQLYLNGLVLVFLLNCGLAYASCQRYAMRGFATEGFLNAIIANSSPNDTILVVGKPMVEGEGVAAGLPVYLKKYNRTNLWIFPITKPDSDINVSLGLLQAYQFKSLETISNRQNIQIIAVFSGLENDFIKENTWFNPVFYRRYKFKGGYVVYAKK